MTLEQAIQKATLDGALNKVAFESGYDVSGYTFRHLRVYKDATGYYVRTGKRATRKEYIVNYRNLGTTDCPIPVFRSKLHPKERGLVE